MTAWEKVHLYIWWYIYPDHAYGRFIGVSVAFFSNVENQNDDVAAIGLRLPRQQN